MERERGSEKEMGKGRDEGMKGEKRKKEKKALTKQQHFIKVWNNTKVPTIHT